MPGSVSHSGKSTDSRPEPSKLKIMVMVIRTIIIFFYAIALMSTGIPACACGGEILGDSVLWSGAGAAGKERELKEVTFLVGMHCNNCVKKINENISFEKGVKALDISLEDKTVRIRYDASKTSEKKLSEAIEALGYSVETLKGKQQEQPLKD